MSSLLPFPPLAEAEEDLVARREALDVHRSFVVEAPAGSGKTSLLIQRFLKLLSLESTSDSAQILAITFTRKAAHEMRHRIMEQLENARDRTLCSDANERSTRLLAEAALATDERLNWGLISHPDRLNIITIDSLCIRIARNLPVGSGVADHSPQEDASSLFRSAATRTFDRLGGENVGLHDALSRLLLHRDGDLRHCILLVADMLSWRDQWNSLIPAQHEQLSEEYLDGTVLPKFERALKQGICRGLSRLSHVMPKDVLSRLCGLASRMAQHAEDAGETSLISICRDLAGSPQSSAEDLAVWKAIAHLLITSSGKEWRKGLTRGTLGFNIAKQHRADLQAIIASLEGNEAVLEALCALTVLPPMSYPSDQWLVAKALFRVLNHALGELQEVFAEQRTCDFTEFSLAALRALSEAKNVREIAHYVGTNLRHLLVDEMQDTSTSQYELIGLLTRFWRGTDETVFLVGDPKQSIYLFRQARVARFLKILRSQRLGELPLHPLHLSANFRSQGALVNQFNDTFDRVFSSSVHDADPESLAYRKVFAGRQANNSLGLAWHLKALPYSRDSTAAIRRRSSAKFESATEIREIIERLRLRPLPSERRSKPWKIAVLVRNRSHLMAVVRALKLEPKIPFRAVKVDPLGERQEILDLVALTRALLHPADRTAWLALLRAPWCGLVLNDVHVIAGDDDESLRRRTIPSLIEDRLHLLSRDAQSRLEPLSHVMKIAAARRHELPLAKLVQRTWYALGIASFLGPEGRANVERYFELLEELELAGSINAEKITEALTDLYAAELTEPSAVDLMTIHHAKGLEFDCVIVPELQAGSVRSRMRLLTWMELEEESAGDDGVAPGVIAPVQPKGQDSYDLVRWMRSLERERSEAELKRLFYVACTRAREEVHLFAEHALNKNGEPHPNSDSLLSAAWPAAWQPFEKQQSQPAVLDRVAAEAAPLAPAEASRTLLRMPLSALPRLSLNDPIEPSTVLAAAVFERPQGSLEARALGDVTHILLQSLTSKIAHGSSNEAMLKDLPDWKGRTAVLLRSHGLVPAKITPATTLILNGLQRTLRSDDGAWILSAHPEGRWEYPIGTASGEIRLDRTFLAGERPGTFGNDHRWIIDYKTGTHGAQGLEEYMAEQQMRYEPQLARYARHMSMDGLAIRLGLFFPMLTRLIWWPHES